jgi:hypothetical protein
MDTIKYQFGQWGNTTLILTTDQNNSIVSRAAQLALKSSGVTSTTINILQQGSAPFVSVDKLSLQVDPNGLRDSIVITSNTRWTLSTPEWIHPDKSSGDSGTTKVILNCYGNISSTPKQGELVITSASQPIRIPVIQNNPPDRLKVGLIAFYPFNGKVEDESGNNYHLLNNGTTLSTDRFGSASKAAGFNGVDAWLKIPKLLKGDSLREFTLSMWVKKERMNNLSIVSFLPSENSMSGCTSIFGLETTSTSNRSRFYIVTAKNEPYSCTTINVEQFISNPSGKWSHVVLVQRYSNQQFRKEYIYTPFFNGAKPVNLVGSIQNPLATSFSHNGAIGCNLNGMYDFFQGSVDDVRIYNRALSDEEVQQLYNLKY